MKNVLFILFFIITCFSILPGDCEDLLYSTISSNSALGIIGEECRLEVRKLTPTQSHIGFLAMEAKLEKIDTKKREGDKKLKKYIKKKVVPVIIGPVFEGKRKTDKVAYYMIDRHHTMSALLEFDPEYKAYIKIVQDYRSLYFSEFWPLMIKRNYVFLKSLGEFINPLDLPKTLNQLEDDRFRSLAWQVREQGCFDNLNDVAFQEFRWADFLRDRVHFQNLDDAMKLSISLEAKQLKLPGYKGECKLDDTDN